LELGLRERPPGHARQLSRAGCWTEQRPARRSIARTMHIAPVAYRGGAHRGWEWYS
jgi:hypothetical protein